MAAIYDDAPMWIMIAGPYSSGARTEGERIRARGGAVYRSVAELP
jgi:hypothetical protein